MKNQEEKSTKESAVLTRLGKIGSDKWEYKFYHYDPSWQGSNTRYYAYAEKIDNHFVLTKGDTGNRDSTYQKNFGVEEITPNGVLEADRRIREAVLEHRKYFPQAPLEESVDENPLN